MYMNLIVVFMTLNGMYLTIILIYKRILHFSVHNINKNSSKCAYYYINDIKQFTEDNPLNIEKWFMIEPQKPYNVRIKYTRKLHDSIDSTEQ